MANIQTIRDVAREAGVSACTASYALRGSPKVSAATTDKVRMAAEKLGYRLSVPVSQWMRALRTRSDQQTWEKIYYVIPEEPWRENRYAKSYFEGGRKRAERHGYELEPMVFDPREMSDKRLSDIIWSRGVRGLVIGPLRKDKRELHLTWEKFAVASFNLYEGTAHMDRAANDYYGSVVTTMRQVYARGYRRVGMVLYRYLDEAYELSLTAAYRRHGEEMEGLETVPPLMLNTDTFDVETFKLWFREHQPECVIAVHCVLPFLDAMKLQVPEDVGYASMNRVSATRDCAGLQHDFERMGATAVELVISQLNRDSIGPVEYPTTVLLRPEWIDGPSLRPVPPVRA
jgi:LacI family transcriptional regulator